MEIENQTEVFALSPEQQEILSLLERLFGRAISNRYVDFLRLAASATGLRVSRPLAGHALRELESMIRSSLVVPMDVTVIVSEADQKRSDDALRALAQLDFDETTLQRAAKALAPQHNHSEQIKLIAERLGLAPDGDIAGARVSLSKTVGRVHERYYHHDQPVDDISGEISASFRSFSGISFNPSTHLTGYPICFSRI